MSCQQDRIDHSTKAQTAITDATGQLNFDIKLSRSCGSMGVMFFMLCISENNNFPAIVSTPFLSTNAKPAQISQVSYIGGPKSSFVSSTSLEAYLAARTVVTRVIDFDDSLISTTTHFYNKEEAEVFTTIQDESSGEETQLQYIWPVPRWKSLFHLNSGRISCEKCMDLRPQKKRSSASCWTCDRAMDRGEDRNRCDECCEAAGLCFHCRSGSAWLSGVSETVRIEWKGTNRLMVAYFRLTFLSDDLRRNSIAASSTLSALVPTPRKIARERMDYMREALIGETVLSLRLFKL
jgi:hypothetical protein